MPPWFLTLFKGLLEKIKIILISCVSHTLRKVKNDLRHWKMFVDLAISTYWCPWGLEAQVGAKRSALWYIVVMNSGAGNRTDVGGGRKTPPKRAEGAQKRYISCCKLFIFVSSIRFTHRKVKSHTDLKKKRKLTAIKIRDLRFSLSPKDLIYYVDYVHMARY